MEILIVLAGVIFLFFTSRFINIKISDLNRKKLWKNLSEKNGELLGNNFKSDKLIKNITFLKSYKTINITHGVKSSLNDNDFFAFDISFKFIKDRTFPILVSSPKTIIVFKINEIFPDLIVKSKTPEDTMLLNIIKTNKKIRNKVIKLKNKSGLHELIKTSNETFNEKFLVWGRSEKSTITEKQQNYILNSNFYDLNVMFEINNGFLSIFFMNRGLINEKEIEKLSEFIKNFILQ